MDDHYIKLLIAIHKDNERQGPGSTSDTLRALELTNLDLSSVLSIADIGCGTGSQTLTLAKHTNGQIKAVDLFPEFLGKLKQQTSEANLSDRITPVLASMDQLPFAENTFDLLWSEGAIYIMGFRKGLQYWKQFLKPGGVIAVSEISWITDERPKAIEEFWKNAYPEIDTVSGKIEALESAGYEMLGHFTLPESSWMDNYYAPLQESAKAYIETHDPDDPSLQFIEQELSEVELYQKYKDYYSYGFYVARKSD